MDIYAKIKILNVLLLHMQEISTCIYFSYMYATYLSRLLKILRKNV